MTPQGNWAERDNSLYKHEMNSIPDSNRFERADSLAMGQSNFETLRDQKYENYQNFYSPSPTQILNRDSIKPSDRLNEPKNFAELSSILSSDDSIEMRRRRKENTLREFNQLQTIKDQFNGY
jgi:hypothetical protein